MDQPKANFVQTRFEKLLKHYDINDFTRFLAKMEFLPRSTYELKFLPSGKSAPKQEIISSLLSHVSSRDQFASGLLDIFCQYTKFVSEDVALTLSEIPSARKVALTLSKTPSTKKHFSHNKKGSNSDSCSSSSFSDDSDPCQPSQECPTTDISECLATDPGYCTQSNSLGLELSLTSNVQLPSVECLEANSRQLKPTPMHHERTKKNRRSAGIVYNITNNHFNVMPKNSTSRGSSKQIYSLPQHQSPNQDFRTTTDGLFPLQSSVCEKITKFQRVLQKCCHEFTVCLNVQSLLPYLCEQELLTWNEFETLKTGTQNEQNQSLLRILLYKGEHAYERFLKCLLNDKEHSGHVHLATLLSSMMYPKSIDV